MKNLAIIDNYNPIIPGTNVAIATDNRERQNDYLTLGYILAQVNIKMAATKEGYNI